MKKINTTVQIIIGIVSILLLWCIGAFSNEYAFMSDEDVNSVFYVLPSIVMVLMPALLMVYAFLGKRKGMKEMYFFAVLSVWLPVMSYIGSCIFSDDGNILCWIYGLTLGLVSYPFGRLAWSTFEAAWLGPFGFDTDLCAGILVVSIALSYVVYKITKTKEKASIGVSQENEKSDDFISDT